MDTLGLSPAQILAGLYNGARPQGMGFIHYTPEPMSEEEAQILLEDDPRRGDYFDYLKGRVMKVEISKLDPNLYDRDNGDGAMQLVLESIVLSGGDVNNPAIQILHKNGMINAAIKLLEMSK